jgi:cation:H+ antiporter
VFALEVFGGITYLFLGGDLLVRGAVALSRRIRVSPMLVGITVVAFGTSAPELLVAIRAAATDHATLAMGNVVGSNIANVLFVVGAPAIIYPMACAHPSARRDGVLMVVATLVFVGLCSIGPLGLAQGSLLLLGITAFLVYEGASAVSDDARTPGESAELERVLGLPDTRRLIGLFIALGSLALAVGAELTVHGATGLALQFGLSEAVVGLSVVAIGTSLPELATTLVAAFKREAEVAVGNILGSNLFNLLAIGGVIAVLSPTPVEASTSFVPDFAVMVAAALVFFYFTWRGATVGRRAGLVMVVLYGAYLAARVPLA